MKRWLSRRKRALIECAPITDAPSSDRAMRSALETARTIPEAAATLDAQQQFDRAIARLVERIEIPREVEEWFVNSALMKSTQRSWKKTAGHPAILATVLAVLVMIGIGVFFFVEQLHDFPGADTARKLLVVARQTKRVQFEPLKTDAINLGDYFFVKFQLEHFEVPMRFADLRATGARVFENEDGERIAQVMLAESGMQFFLFSPGHSVPASRQSAGSFDWKFVENEGWAGAVEERNGVCFMVAIRGSEADLKPYLRTK